MTDKEIKKYLNDYTNIIEKLRTSKVVGDYGEYIVSTKYKKKFNNIKLAETSSNKGFDAIDDKGNKYEIKSRKCTSWNKPGLFSPGNSNQMEGSDYLIYVEFDNEWNVFRLLKIPTGDISEEVKKSKRFVLSKDRINKYSVL